ncbi:serine/threonine exchange transporter, LAT family [Cetobacterium ceti]|uniref:Serine/threonine exchange transporter, LAT family n=1 Tax=Cetobacterium ceti TaxID=180163 RepID=A0A1T4K7T7_9FUSO|nr:amino acid permease [Cetobacterium ceti]SJZ38510.1 serine/threonine exchange transporter, LAT family [Cetobacterium ceti]
MEKLSRNFGFFTVFTTVVGMVIGSGIFVRASSIFQLTGAPGIALALWAVAGLVSLAAGLTIAELGAAIPETGALISWIEKVFGKKMAYIYGWTQVVLYLPATMAALGIVFGSQVSLFFGLNPDIYSIIIGIGTIIFLGILNSLSSKLGGHLQIVSTIGKLLPIFAIIICGFLYGAEHQSYNLTPFINLDPVPGKSLFVSLGAAMTAIIFAYDGWIGCGTLAGEVKNPGKTLPKAISIGLVLIGIVYIAINIAFLMVMPAGALAQTQTPANDVARILFGNLGEKIVGIAILISIFGTINGYMLTSIRVPYAMAIEGMLPYSEVLGKVDKKTGTPFNSSIFFVILSILFCFTGKFDLLADMTMFVIWIFYIMAFLAVIILRKKDPQLKREYLVPLYPITPIIAIIGGVYVIVATFLNMPYYSLGAIVLSILGLPMYIYLERKKSKNLVLEVN